MKKKDLIMLAVTGLIFLAAGYIAVTQLGLLGGSSSSKSVTVEVAPVVPSGYNADALQEMSDPSKVRDFTVPADLTGLGNPSPFQPF